jgi:hypothetical protein
VARNLLPAIVRAEPQLGVLEQATQLIRDGQRIRVQGTDGYVEILPQRASPAAVGETRPHSRAACLCRCDGGDVVAGSGRRIS